MEARRRSGRGAGLQGGGAQSAVRQMFTRYRSTCVIHCVLVFQLELLFLLCVFFLFRSVSCVPAFLRILPLVS